MSFKNHPKIKKARVGKILGLVISIVLVFAGIFSFFAFELVKQYKSNNKISFAEAYNEERLDEDIYIYVDVTQEPYEIGHYSDNEQYYYVSDGYDLYVIKCSKSESNYIGDMVRQDGSYELVGTVTRLSEEVIDTAIEVYNEGEEDPDEIINREDFDWYFQDVALNVHMQSNAETILILIGFVLLVIGTIAFIAAIIEMSRYSSAFGHISEMDGQMIAAELDSPQTVYLKNARTYLTPRFIVSLGSRCAIIPYANILWAYKYSHSYNFVPVVENVRIYTTDHRLIAVAEMHAFTSRKQQAIMSIFSAIQYYNPNVRFGYTNENINYFNALKYQQMNVNNNAV
jgi:hypothetical protein